jgi:hypothetical protein
VLIYVGPRSGKQQGAYCGKSRQGPTEMLPLMLHGPAAPGLRAPDSAGQLGFGCVCWGLAIAPTPQSCLDDAHPQHSLF